MSEIDQRGRKVEKQVNIILERRPPLSNPRQIFGPVRGANADVGDTSTAAVPAAPAGTEYEEILIRDRGYLPHWQSSDPEKIYSVTFRLADSLPASVLAEIQAERERLLARARAGDRPLSKADQEDIERLFSERVEAYLDSASAHATCPARTLPRCSETPCLISTVSDTA
jgi:hypothetical protein